MNTGARLHSGTVPVPKLWCEHGLSFNNVDCQGSNNGMDSCVCTHLADAIIIDSSEMMQHIV